MAAVPPTSQLPTVKESENTNVSPKALQKQAMAYDGRASLKSQAIAYDGRASRASLKSQDADMAELRRKAQQKKAERLLEKQKQAARRRYLSMRNYHFVVVFLSAANACFCAHLFVNTDRVSASLEMKCAFVSLFVLDSIFRFAWGFCHSRFDAFVAFSCVVVFLLDIVHGDLRVYPLTALKLLSDGCRLYLLMAGFCRQDSTPLPAKAIAPRRGRDYRTQYLQQLKLQELEEEQQRTRLEQFRKMQEQWEQEKLQQQPKDQESGSQCSRQLDQRLQVHQEMHDLWVQRNERHSQNPPLPVLLSQHQQQHQQKQQQQKQQPQQQQEEEQQTEVDIEEVHLPVHASHDEPMLLGPHGSTVGAWSQPELVGQEPVNTRFSV
eukprot:TRINITY_DN6448_c0_g6_i1.p1 TRINITY_DN6448_c0_g6~~TRINITY_DN6448_c0_g6_i1.p1  ORF type:complete len:379 (-),score=88.48 TRINITY_DN6448_c0_g6_i1:81-1217(-)